MKIELRKYFWAFTLLTIAVCAYFAANAASVLVGAALPEAQQRVRPLGSGVVRRPGAGGAARDVTQILARNIFCSSCEPSAEVRTAEASGDDQPSNGDPVRSSLGLRLIATLVSDQDSAWSYAALTETESQKTGLYGIGSKIPGAATVEDILDRRVILRNGGRAEYIDLDRDGADSGSSASAKAPPPPTPVRGGASPELAGGVRALGPNKWEIRRSALNKVLGNTTLLARSARIVPSVRNGKPNGFRLYAVRPGSIYSLIGLQNGDTIHAINGHEISTPDKALELYTKIRNASYLTISYSRGGATKTHDYVIR